jgi:uncharacterized protein (DUF58 family)
MALAILPSRAGVAGVALLAAAATVAAFAGVPVATVAAASGVAVVLCLAFVAVDVAASRRAWREAPLVWQRRLPPALAVGVRRAIEGSLVNAGKRRWRVELFDHIDPSFDVEGMPAQSTVAPESVTTLAYEVVPHRRGTARFEPAELRVRTLGGSCELRVACGEAQALRVYPNFATVSRYALARRRPQARRDRHQELSAARQRHRLQAARRLPSRRRDPRHRLEGDAAPRPARSCASTRTSATRASSSCSTADGGCAPTKAAAAAPATSTPRSKR